MEMFALIAVGAVVYGVGFLQGFCAGAICEMRRHNEWLKKSGDLAQNLQRELQAFLLEREDYHRSIVAWIRGRERA